MGTGLFLPQFAEPSALPSVAGLRRNPAGPKPLVPKGQVCLPQMLPQISGLIHSPLAALGGQRVRNTPRRRFLYGWSSRTTIRQMLSTSVERLRYLESFAPMMHCEPLHHTASVSKVFLPSPVTRTLRHVHSRLDENALLNIAPQSALTGLVEPIEVKAPTVVDPRAVVAPVWARTEAIRSKLRGIRAGDGLFLPQVAVSPLMTNFLLTKAPETTVATSDRRGVVIPFQELAAAASHSKELAHSVSLRRLSS